MFWHQLTRFALRIKCNDLRAQHKAKPKSIANRAATFTTEEFKISLTLQSIRATRFSWCSSVNSFKIFISFPSKFWDFAKFFFVIAFIATTLFGAWKENILFQKEILFNRANQVYVSWGNILFMEIAFCILCVKMHLCSFLLQKFCLLATELDNLFQNPITAVFQILFYDPVIN